MSNYLSDTKFAKQLLGLNPLSLSNNKKYR